MRLFTLLGFSFVFASLIFVSINNENMVFGETSDPNQNDSIELEGQFNILEIIYADGTYDMKYYLFVDNPLANNPTPYQLEFTNPSNSLMDLVSENVVVRGYTSNSIVSFSNSVNEVPIMIDSIEKINPNPSPTSGLPGIAQSGVEGRNVPSTIQSYVILSKFNDFPDERHDTAYFNNTFFNSTGGVPSLKNYFNDASYGKLNITSSGIKNWASLPNSASFYNTILSNDVIFNFTQHAIDAAEASGEIDFNGADNETQNMWNTTTGDFGYDITNGVDNDDIDHLFLIFNTMSFGAQPNGCSCAFAFLGPVPITPSQGLRSVLISYLPDSDLFGKFSVDTSYRGGIGIPAHEFGHTLDWDHTHTFSPGNNGPYNDPWSIMSKGAESVAENNAGPIAYNRDHAKWIASEDIITVSDNMTATFTLDKLSDPSPGPGVLMAKIPFGAGLPNEFYTLETRVNDIFDHTPENKKGLLMYHVRDAGHSGTWDLTAEAALVDVNGASTNADWKDANLVVGQNFTQNNVTVSYLADNGTSITVKVENNVSAPSLCTPPGAGNWVVTVSCTMTASANAAGDVNIQTGAVLTIPSGITLTIPSGFGANILSGGGILINLGGTLIISI